MCWKLRSLKMWEKNFYRTLMTGLESVYSGACHHSCIHELISQFYPGWKTTILDTSIARSGMTFCSKAWLKFKENAQITKVVSYIQYIWGKDPSIPLRISS